MNQIIRTDKQTLAVSDEQTTKFEAYDELVATLDHLSPRLDELRLLQRRMHDRSHLPDAAGSTDRLGVVREHVRLLAPQPHRQCEQRQAHRRRAQPPEPDHDVCTGTRISVSISASPIVVS